MTAENKQRVKPAFRGRVRGIHFVGIGGVGMSGIAEVLLAQGFAVSGSDPKSNEATRRLAQRGARVEKGHHESHLGGADVVVYSSAVPASNPELLAARQRGIPVIPRAEMLGELMRLKHGVAIAGSHGKTTTTSLVATLLSHSGLDPTVVIGGRLNALGSGAAQGAGDLLVAEADESDGSFYHLVPTIAVVTSIDLEHLDHYGSEDGLLRAFTAFLSRIPFFGLVVACADDPRVCRVLSDTEKRIATYSVSHERAGAPPATRGRVTAHYQALNWRAEGLKGSFEAYRDGALLGDFELPMPGLHNAANALAAIAVGQELGVELSAMQHALAQFAGVHRRFSVVGTFAGVTIVDDYAHHPAEITATLKAARKAYDGRIAVIFQPHRYSRTQLLRGAFIEALEAADLIVISDIYPAGEPPIPGISAETLVADLHHRGHPAVWAGGDIGRAVSILNDRLQSGDTVLALGAGSITNAASMLSQALQAKAPSALA